MVKSYLLLFIFFSINLFCQTKYKPKILFQFDIPRRYQIGINLLSSKPFSFSVKGGYQLGILSLGGFHGNESNITKQWSLNGLVMASGIEYNLKKPFHKLNFEFEYGLLSGYYETPKNLGSGKDYFVTRSTVNSKNYTLLMGYNYHLVGNLNTSLFIKIGAIYRTAEEYFYFQGSRLPTAKNDLKTPYYQNYIENEFNLRFGVQHCFGYKKLNNSRYSNQYYNALIYIKQMDNVIDSLFKHYQYSITGKREYHDLKKEFKKKFIRSRLLNDSIQLNDQFIHFKNRINVVLANRTMLLNTYKKIIPQYNGTVKTRRIRKCYYKLREKSKYKSLYEKYRLYK